LGWKLEEMDEQQICEVQKRLYLLCFDATSVRSIISNEPDVMCRLPEQIRDLKSVYLIFQVLLWPYMTSSCGLQYSASDKRCAEKKLGSEAAESFLEIRSNLRRHAFHLEIHSDMRVQFLRSVGFVVWLVPGADRCNHQRGSPALIDVSALGQNSDFIAKHVAAFTKQRMGCGNPAPGTSKRDR
jgi:hypothetical protein